ncbi:MAG: Macrocin-O-methyltransferase (TylF) [Betaproteobacteria bacterium ADurb.Bin341]|nr:MAG: Macrocin-O-methyltransferase (TylF) [Betaproteobacteria bacterium ADurb.Bin341]
MGFAMKNLEYLSNKGYLANPRCAILDIGSQNLYHATPEAIRSFVERHGTIKDEHAFEEEAKRISYFSWPRPGERTSYISELLDLTPFEYTSYDVCPALKTEIFDLNEENLPEHYREHFDIVLNFGTTEHIINQLNSFRVMHDAVKVGGIFFHQLPSVGWIDHGYFCYHDCFFIDLANANGYEIVERWYTLAGQSSLGDQDIRDPEQPEVPRSGNCSPNFLTLPSFNLNIILRKRTSKPFAVGLELATSHSAVSSEVATLYAGGSRVLAPSGITSNVRSEQQRWAPAPPPASAIPGRELAKELARRISRRLGFSSDSSSPGNTLSTPAPSVAVSVCASAPQETVNNTPPSQAITPDSAQPDQLPTAAVSVCASAPQEAENNTSSPQTVTPEAFPIPLLDTLSTLIIDPVNTPLDAMVCVEKGRELVERQLFPEAFGYFNRARAIVHQFPHAMIELRNISQLYAQAGALAWSRGDLDKAVAMSVVALEADSHNKAPRELLASIEAMRPGQDTTRHCYVFYDQERANQVHREAIRRSLEFTAISGVIGDVLEFGVLAGWSARIFAETMRDCMVMGDLYLFDSFAGLPEYDSSVDRDSYEIAGRNIWSDKMKFPDEFVATLGGSLEMHIKGKLSGIIRAERIKTRRGFYSESLKTPIAAKAALVHIDCDLYQSTVEVLDALLRDDVLQDGCVLMFDDWNCNKASPYFGERRAFREFLEKQNRYTASQFFTYGFNGAAFILHQEPSV